MAQGCEKGIRSATQSCYPVQVGGIGEDRNQTSQPNLLSHSSELEMYELPPPKPGMQGRQPHASLGTDLGDWLGDRFPQTSLRAGCV